jgi:ribonuclease R
MYELFLKLIDRLSLNSLSIEEHKILLPWIKKNIIKNNSGILSLNSQYILAIIENTHQDEAIAIPLNNKQEKRYFIDSEFLENSKEDDIVLIQRLFIYGAKQKAKVISILKSSELYAIAYYQQNSFINIKTKMTCEANNKNNIELQENTFYQIDINLKQIIKKIGHIEDRNLDENLTLAMYNKNKHFNPIIEKEVDLFSKNIEVDQYPNRKDLTNLNFCTIDPISAKDYDDAIYFDEKNQILYVAIADVSHYVKPNTKLDKEALERSFTIYFPHKSIPMLPRTLSENLCSLAPHLNRLAYVCEMKIENNCIIDSSFYEAVIHSKQRFNYDEVDKFLDKKEPFPVDFLSLEPLFELSKIWRKERLKNGFNFNHKEISIHLTRGLTIEKTSYSNNTASHQLIEECMLLTNQETAKKLNNKGIFRIHQSPSYKKIETLYENITSLGLLAQKSSDPKIAIYLIQEEAKKHNMINEVDELIIKAQMKAKYSYHNFGHFGLGFTNYTHFTSPIRRYSDLIAHRLLKGLELDNIEAIALYISTQEIQINTIVSSYINRLYAKWASKQIGKTFLAKVIDVNKKILIIEDIISGAKVEVDDISSQFTLFSTLKIEIIKVDLIYSTIKAKILNNE